MIQFVNPNTEQSRVFRIKANGADYLETISWYGDMDADGVATNGDYFEILKINHNVILDDLTPQQTYHFRVKSTDQLMSGADREDNDANPSPDFFFTMGTVDNTPPVISNVDVSYGYDSATITWVTDEPSTSTVNYGVFFPAGFAY